MEEHSKVVVNGLKKKSPRNSFSSAEGGTHSWVDAGAL
jgi:hypothetical protein